MIQSECNITGVKRGEKKKKKIPFSSNTTKNIHIKCNITGGKRGERKGRRFQFQWNLMTEACRERNRVNSELGSLVLCIGFSVPKPPLPPFPFSKYSPKFSHPTHSLSPLYTPSIPILNIPQNFLTTPIPCPLSIPPPYQTNPKVWASKIEFPHKWNTLMCNLHKVKEDYLSSWLNYPKLEKQINRGEAIILYPVNDWDDLYA